MTQRWTISYRTTCLHKPNHSKHTTYMTHIKQYRWQRHIQFRVYSEDQGNIYVMQISKSLRITTLVEYHYWINGQIKGELHIISVCNRRPYLYICDANIKGTEDNNMSTLPLLNLWTNQGGITSNIHGDAVKTTIVYMWSKYQRQWA